MKRRYGCSHSINIKLQLICSKFVLAGIFASAALTSALVIGGQIMADIDYGSDEKTLRLWEAASGRELARFEGHSKWVTSVAFSPDGRHIISGSWDNTLRLWEAVSGRDLGEVERTKATAEAEAVAKEAERRRVSIAASYNPMPRPAAKEGPEKSSEQRTIGRQSDAELEKSAGENALKIQEGHLVHNIPGKLVSGITETVEVNYLRKTAGTRKWAVLGLSGVLFAGLAGAFTQDTWWPMFKTWLQALGWLGF